MEIKLGIEDLSPTKKKLLLMLVLIAIAVLFVVYFVQPYLGKIEQLSAEIEKQVGDIKVAERETARLPELIAENQVLMVKLLELQLQLPAEKEVSELLRQVSKLGTKRGLQILLWRPGGTTIHVSNEVYEIPVEVEMRGSYHRFGQFFSNVTKLDRIVNVSNINMEAVRLQERKKINISFTATTYSPIPEAKRKELKRAAALQREEME